jgi:hypothetical protein
MEKLMRSCLYLMKLEREEHTTEFFEPIMCMLLIWRNDYDWRSSRFPEGAEL